MWNKISKQIDMLLSPPYAYRNVSIASQNRDMRVNIARGTNRIKNIILLLKNYYFLASSFLLTPLAGILSILGYKFFMVDLRQVGSVLWLDLYLRDLKISGKSHRRLFVLRSKHTDANKFFIDRYQDYATFISNPLLKFLLGPFFINPWFHENGFHYEAGYERTDTLRDKRCFAHSTCNNFVEKIGVPLIGFSDKEISEYWGQLSDFIKPDRPFVLCHIRDNGYYQDFHRTSRNADIYTYEKTFSFLIERGMSVVRLGSPQMVRAEDMEKRLGKHFFNYAHSPVRSEALDIFLASQCCLFMGCASGPELFPIIFDKPGCAINYYNATNSLGFKKGDLSSFKKIRYKDSGKLVPYDQLMVPPLSENLTISELDDLGLVLESNTEDEILETVKEFFIREDDAPSRIQKRANEMLPLGRRGVDSPGYFSKAILKEYFEEE